MADTQKTTGSLNKKNSYDKENVNEITPGMLVEATSGDLGETDVSKPKVTDVERDAQGNVQSIEVEKGTIFKKKLDIPVNRIQSVEGETAEEGEVKVAADEQELERLPALGTDILDDKKFQDDPLDELEQALPTTEGMREREADIPSKRTGSHSLLRIIGPGFIAGMSGNDSSAVTAYAVDGATVGYGHLWLILLATPLYQAVQYACAKIGRVSQKGLSDLLREHYGRPVSGIASTLLIITNLALIAADLAAVGTGLQLITTLNWVWFLIPVALILWYLTVYRNFESLKKIFLVMSFAFVTYIITAFLSHANPGQVLIHTVVPQVDFSFAGISSAVAILGATISPYSMFWQVQGEKEEERPGPMKQQLRIAKLDVASGTISGNLVAYFIIVCTSATLFTHHQSINTAADAARSLEPLLGPFARYLFAVGLIGSGIVAIPVLLASTSYAVAGTFGWPSGLSKKPWQNEGFYLILTGSLIVGVGIALFRINPIQLIFWANILAGILAPLLVIAILIVGNNRKIMRDQRLSLLNNFGLVLIAVILLVAATLLFYGLATGQSS